MKTISIIMILLAPLAYANSDCYETGNICINRILNCEVEDAIYLDEEIVGVTAQFEWVYQNPVVCFDKKGRPVFVPPSVVTKADNVSNLVEHGLRYDPVKAEDVPAALLERTTSGALAKCSRARQRLSQLYPRCQARN